MSDAQQRLEAQELWGYWCAAHKVHMAQRAACCEFGGHCSHHAPSCDVVRLVTDPLAAPDSVAAMKEELATKETQ